MGNTRNRHVNPWWVAVVSGMASYIDSCAIISSGTALVIYQQTFGLDNGQFGLISAALTFCIAIGSILGGSLGDRFGRKPVFSVTMGMLIIGAVTMIFAQTFPLLLLGEILMGLGVGADLPVSLATIAEEAPDDKRGKMLLFSDILWVVGIVLPRALAPLSVTGVTWAARSCSPSLPLSPSWCLSPARPSRSLRFGLRRTRTVWQAR